MNEPELDHEKTVYILGAGFSIPAGAPPQARILEDIFKLEDDERVKKDKAHLSEFLRDDLGFDVNTIKDVALEDIYTPLDGCIADGTALKNRSSEDLQKIRENLGRLISAAIARAISKAQDSGEAKQTYIKDFARYIVAKASIRAERAKDTNDSCRAKSYDPLSIISLNWDILLDNALHHELREQAPDPQHDYSPFGVVDYCCYISSIDPADRRVRSGLWSLGCRGFNVKLLKLHGSMNWLQCPNCQRLFVGFGLKEDILEHVGKTPCRHCEKSGYRNCLGGSLIMPTFLKDLSNFQIKLVWQNAGVELMEARRLVFIGYSLPHADFEFRQLLSRMAHKDAIVDVVLFEKTDDEESRRRYTDEKRRYSQFFGSRQINFYPEGATEFVRTHMASLSA